MIRAKQLILTSLLFLLLILSRAHAGPTADAAVKKGFIQCGVNTGLAGFAQPDSSGEWRVLVLRGAA